MSEHKIENYIANALVGEAQDNALALIAHLRASDMQFERGGGWWEKKLYWCVNYNDESVCYILIYTPACAEDSTEPWVVWTDDSGSNWFADSSLSEENKEIAWSNVDICGSSEATCGGCMGRKRKTIFGRDFDNVCGITFRFNNPNADAVECMKGLIAMRKRDIEKKYYAERIIPLNREKWQDYEFPFHYISHNYYDVKIMRSDSGFDVSFIKKPFDTPYEYEYLPNEHFKLFEPHWDKVKAWGIVENGRLIAVIETAVEEWSNRLRVTNIWVDENYHRKGIGAALMDISVQRAKEEKRRVLMLETQSRNEGAISFYLDYGFTLIGFDACAYQNDDLDRKEVRMELGIFL